MDSALGRVRETVWKAREGRVDRESWKGTKRIEGRDEASLRLLAFGLGAAEAVAVDAASMPSEVAARVISTDCGGSAAAAVEVFAPGTDWILEVVWDLRRFGCGVCPAIGVGALSGGTTNACCGISLLRFGNGEAVLLIPSTLR